ncbi:MAG: TetR/AcrR family transcriptional regulator [Bacteroidia bacterium]|nr:TetR/AcrR family transcriptional regulator [Bacteroidia bacterium]
MDAAERIKEAAVQEFARHGYDGARLERIARAAGVHTAQIHYYFRNKRHLYETVQPLLTPPSLESVIEPLREAGKPLPERVQSFYERFYEAAQHLVCGKGHSALLPPILLNPQPLAVPQWKEALQNAQTIGLLKPLRMEFILAQQWSLALLPIWFDFPKDSWQEYYSREAPRLFWEAVRSV